VATPVLEMAMAARSEAERERDFWKNHLDEYSRRYADQFVAVSDGEVVANAADLVSLAGILLRRGIDVRRLWVRLISS
jgi:hypothetical protein